MLLFIANVDSIDYIYKKVDISDLIKSEISGIESVLVRIKELQFRPDLYKILKTNLGVFLLYFSFRNIFRSSGFEVFSKKDFEFLSSLKSILGLTNNYLSISILSEIKLCF